MILTSENYVTKAEAVMKKLCNEKDLKGHDWSRLQLQRSEICLQ